MNKFHHFSSLFVPTQSLILFNFEDTKYSQLLEFCLKKNCILTILSCNNNKSGYKRFFKSTKKDNHKNPGLNVGFLLLLKAKADICVRLLGNFILSICSKEKAASSILIIPSGKITFLWVSEQRKAKRLAFAILKHSNGVCFLLFIAAA